MITTLNFDGPEQPYRTRGGEWAVVTGREGDHWNGVLLPSELENSWDLAGNDLDGQSKYDLVSSCGANSAEAKRWSATASRLRGEA